MELPIPARRLDYKHECARLQAYAERTRSARMILHHAILMLTIVSPSETVLDYEYYDNPMHCQAVANEIAIYNKDYNKQNAPYGVFCKCVQAPVETSEV